MVISSPVVVIGGFGRGNFGDDLLMLADLSIIRRVYKDDEIVVLGHSKVGYCRRLLDGPKYVARKGEVTVRTDVVVYGGGTQFFSFPGTGPKDMGLSRVRRVLKGLLTGYIPLRRLWSLGSKIIIDVHCRQVAVSFGLGPFFTNESEQLAREKLSKCEFISVRDEVAYKYCEKWGLDRVVLRADFGFARDLWYPLSKPLVPKNKVSGRIGLIPMHWPHTMRGTKHFDAMVSVAKECEKAGIEVVFFIFNKYHDASCAEILRKGGFSVISWEPYKHKIEEFVMRLGECDLLVTARAHGAIVGATVGIPSICAEVGPKLKIVANMLGEGADIWPSPFECDDGLGRINKMIGNLPKASMGVIENAGIQKRRALCAADEFEAFLRSAKKAAENKL